MNSEGVQLRKQFIPPNREVELKEQAKLASLLIDVHALPETEIIYSKSWAAEFMSFIARLHNNNQRFLHLEIGDNFTLGITDDREVFSWGINDRGQCCKDVNTSQFYIPCT